MGREDSRPAVTSVPELSKERKQECWSEEDAVRIMHRAQNLHDVANQEGRRPHAGEDLSNNEHSKQV